MSGYENLPLPEFDDPTVDPLALFRAWLAAADRLGVREAGAFVLATSDERGRASGRVVLLKDVDDRGLIFSSHIESRKGREIAATGWASCVFHWRETLQQIIVSGPVDRLPDTESDALFAERPRAAQATTVASHQSRPLDDESALRTAAAALAGGERPLSRPPGWGGYVIRPERIEFWHGRTDRLHRRLEYGLDDGRWTARRLQP